MVEMIEVYLFQVCLNVFNVSNVFKTYKINVRKVGEVEFSDEWLWTFSAFFVFYNKQISKLGKQNNKNAKSSNSYE